MLDLDLSACFIRLSLLELAAEWIVQRVVTAIRRVAMYILVFLDRCGNSGILTLVPYFYYCLIITQMHHHDISITIRYQFPILSHLIQILISYIISYAGISQSTL